MKNIVTLALIGLLTACSQESNLKPEDWAWLDFQRPTGMNPIISPNKDIKFC